jgi:hypothetical protein
MSIPTQIGLQVTKLALGREVRRVGHKPNIDASSIDSMMGAVMVSKCILEGVAGGVIGLRCVSDDTGDAGE